MEAWTILLIKLHMLTSSNKLSRLLLVTFIFLQTDDRKRSAPSTTNLVILELIRWEWNDIASCYPIDVSAPRVSILLSSIMTSLVRVPELTAYNHFAKQTIQCDMMSITNFWSFGNDYTGLSMESVFPRKCNIPQRTIGALFTRSWERKGFKLRPWINYGTLVVYVQPYSFKCHSIVLVEDENVSFTTSDYLNASAR